MRPPVRSASPPSQSVPLPDARWLTDSGVRAGYAYNYRDARGREWGHQGHSVWLGPSTTLPWDLVLATEVRFTYRAYRHPTTYPNNRDLVGGVEYALKSTNRRETEWNVSATLGRNLTKNLSISATWRYDDNDSTSQTYTFDRHVVGLQVSAQFGP